MDYQKVYNALISFRKSNPLEKSDSVYTEVHHIVPRCLGGSDESENLVRLTAREHFVAHRLLTKVCPREPGLALAVLLMMKVQGGKICSSREIEKLKEMAAKNSSETMIQLWKDPLFRESSAKSSSERLKSRWDDLEFRNMMNNTLSNASTSRWRNPEFKEMISRTMMERWKDPDFKTEMNTLFNSQSYKEKVSEGQTRFFNSNPWPWQRQPAQRTRHIWTLAASFWEMSAFNPENKGTIYNRERFSLEFCGGKYERIFQRMIKMFNEGWVPTKCADYLLEFGDRM